MRPGNFAVVVTCEHGGHRIPARYAPLFRGRRSWLTSHRGHDRGTSVLARELARGLKASLHLGEFSRLLVDLNRSLHHRAVFSAVTRTLARDEKRKILGRYYFPYRRAVETEIARHVAAGRFVLHLSVHSFAPVLNGVARPADIGLLYDPARRQEKECCARLRAALTRLDPALRVRRNYPYRGSADGFTTHLRRRFPGRRYAGIELEINQRYPRRGGGRWRRLRTAVLAAVSEAIDRDRRRVTAGTKAKWR